jgi:hypothetical protein
MQNIITENDLRVAILQLESRQADEGKVLKAQFLVAVESIKPINLIRSTLMEAAESTDLQDNMINSSIGLSAGYLSKVLFQGFSNSPLKKLLGTALMFGIKNLVAQNPEIVKSLGRGLFKIVRNILNDHDKNTGESDSSEKTAP